MKSRDIFTIAEEFMRLADGELISDPEEYVWVSRTARFTRKSLKHFIESRRGDRNTKKQIMYLLEKARDVSLHPEINILNPNQTHKSSRLLGKLYKGTNKAIVLILDKGIEPKDVIALYFQNEKTYRKLQKKKK